MECECGKGYEEDREMCLNEEWEVLKEEGDVKEAWHGSVGGMA